MLTDTLRTIFKRDLSKLKDELDLYLREENPQAIVGLLKKPLYPCATTRL